MLLRVADGEIIGTLLTAEQPPLIARKQWLAGMSNIKGSLQLDAGAVKVLRQAGKSLLPVGVVAVAGRFERGDLVRCIDEGGVEIARGLVNYSTDEVNKIMGQSSGQIEALLGYQGDKELLHRDNLVLM